MTATVTLYGRPGCCLCDAARVRLERLRARHRFALREVDITSDDELHLRFLERIPVVALDGEEIYDYEVDEEDLVRRLSRPPSSNVRRIE